MLQFVAKHSAFAAAEALPLFAGLAETAALVTGDGGRVFGKDHQRDALSGEGPACDAYQHAG